MTGKSPSSSSTKAGDLHAGRLPKAEDRRKKQVEGEVVSSVAGAMAGEAVAAITGKGPKRKH